VHGPALNPSDSSFSTALNDTKTQFESNNPKAQSGGTSLYVYGLSEGGSPFILSEAKIYKAKWQLKPCLKSTNKRYTSY
jgi:hypothetical protein